MTTPKQCWYCMHFNATDIGVSNQGECRRYAPSGESGNIAVSGAVFPPVYDGTDESCGDFVPNPESVTTPV